MSFIEITKKMTYFKFPLYSINQVPEDGRSNHCKEDTKRIVWKDWHHIRLCVAFLAHYEYYNIYVSNLHITHKLKLAYFHSYTALTNLLKK